MMDAMMALKRIPRKFLAVLTISFSSASDLVPRPSREIWLNDDIFDRTMDFEPWSNAKAAIAKRRLSRKMARRGLGAREALKILNEPES